MPVITSDPEILGGTPCFKGTRVPLQNLVDYLEGGDTLDVFLDQFPGVTRDQATQALEEMKQPLLHAPVKSCGAASPATSVRLLL